VISYEVELSPEFAQQIEKLNAYDEIANRHLTSAIQGSVIGIQGLARVNAPVFQSRLRNSIQAEVKTGGAAVVGRVFSDITSPYPYPLTVELGRKPGKMPPPDALKRWVQLVIKPPAASVNGIAYLVARSIGRRGIKGKFFMKRAVESSKVRIGMLFREALDRIANEMAVD